jgi:hypothetical protein
VSTSGNTAAASATAAEAARDAAIIGSGVYATEVAGRAAVADGVAFKVQGSGEVAAYEYRRTNSTTSVLIATYPSVNALSFEDRSKEQYLYGELLLAALTDSDGRALAAWLLDGVLRAKFGMVQSFTSPLTFTFDPITGLTTVNSTTELLSSAEQFVAGYKVLGALVDVNSRTYLAMREDGKTYIPKLAVDSIEIVGGGSFADYDAVWSESANYVFTQALVGGIPQIFRTPKAGGKKVQITSTGNNYSPIVSGSVVTYTTDRTTPPSIYGQPLAGGTEAPIESTNLLVPIGNSISIPGGYTAALAALRPTQTLTAQGVSGQITTDMAYRINALPVTLSVTGGSIPASGGVVVTGISTTLFRRTSGSAAVRATIAGIPGVLSWSASASTFTRTAAGSIVTASGTQTATVTSGFVDGSIDPSAQLDLSVILAGTVILWPAYNDPRLPVSPSTTQANIAAMVSTLTPIVKRLIVVGDALGSGILTAARFPAGAAPAATDTESKAWADSYLSLNAWMATTYPDAYFDMQGSLIAAGYSSTVNLVGVDYSIINSTVFTDGIHPGGSGISIIANIINSIITSRGW